MLTRNPEADDKSQFNHYPDYAPRIWHGMSVSVWWRLAVKNRFKIDRYKMAAWVTFFSVMNTIGDRLQAALHRKPAMSTPLVDDPVFIIGHWRTGTTLLHTLLALDDRYATPNHYQCFAPRHFLFSERLCTNLIQSPRQRPMDNMDMSWTEPQEDELALCVRGLPSVYQNTAFPKHENRHLEHLTMEGVSPACIAKWQQELMEFVRYLNYKYRRPLVLKSPSHTGRIDTLLEMFPNARFIHITRDPLDFIPSTMHLWKALNQTNGLQHDTDHVECEDYVFDCFSRMYDGFNRQKCSIPKRNFHEMRYDDLISDPVRTVRRAYDDLRLGDFDEVASTVDEFMQRKRNYQCNKHTVPLGLEAAIMENCCDYIEQFGYARAKPMAKAA